MFERLMVWLYIKFNLALDTTDDELPYEARSTWDNLDEAYDEDED